MKHFIAFDFETTGLEAPPSRAVELGMIRYDLDGNEVNRWSSLFNPGIPIPPEVTAIHGITDAEVEDAPYFADVFPEIMNFLDDPAENHMLAYNAKFDVMFFKNEFALLDTFVSTPTLRGIFQAHCAMRLAKNHVRLRSYRLTSVASALGISLNNAHRAEDDAEAAGRIWYRCGGPAILQSHFERIEAGQQGHHAIETFQF